MLLVFFSYDILYDIVKIVKIFNTTNLIIVFLNMMTDRFPLLFSPLDLKHTRCAFIHSHKRLYLNRFLFIFINKIVCQSSREIPDYFIYYGFRHEVWLCHCCSLRYNCMLI